MSAPVISIILPAYNCMQFISQTVESLLMQTFTDFELLIINDGSTDKTEEIIQSQTDERILYVKNKVNSGLVYSLNKGIELAQGKYIARIDADDLCEPHRLQKQYEWLEQRPGTAVVGSLISFMDINGKLNGNWALDKKTADSKSIRNTMPKENCVAHPSVMMRTNIAKAYQYASYQQHTEDYDLWLRLLGDGHVIEKVPEVLLRYRVHQLSITKTKLQNKNPFFKQFHCKRKFLRYRMKQKKVGWFEMKVCFYMLHNLMVGLAKEVKKKVGAK
jgi:glycosyltransferase involved in cell wall biosynthesis